MKTIRYKENTWYYSFIYELSALFIIIWDFLGYLHFDKRRLSQLSRYSCPADKGYGFEPSTWRDLLIAGGLSAINVLSDVNQLSGTLCLIL